VRRPRRRPRFSAMGRTMVLPGRKDLLGGHVSRPSPRLTPKSRTTKLQEESGRRAPGSRDGTSSARTTCVRNHDVR
jgi:hypothetical protein